MSDNGWPPHGLRYYFIAFTLLLVASIVAFFVLDRPAWATVTVGALTGGFIFDATIDWFKYRRARQNNTD
ncbi:hypothetical protein V5P93_000891 [Actinokineospora auranticolor]|uniref:hypothetical protein n=1 Tax=Actinokineospora auranticolor TaxID=155976 RepID=UPI0011B0C6F3|nr:hypothetical protein [Actinokineospora auranticolor]